MNFYHNQLAPCLFEYEKVIDFPEKVIDYSLSKNKDWLIRNEDAVGWNEGKKILGYDEFPVNFNFSGPLELIKLGKSLYDIATDYSLKNTTSISEFNSCMLRKYSTNQGFLEVESGDVGDRTRRVSCILFLNDISSGGSINFKNFDLSFQPKSCSALVFPSNFSYSFKINRPKEEDSFVIISHFV